MKMKGGKCKGLRISNASNLVYQQIKKTSYCLPIASPETNPLQSSYWT